MSQRRPPTTRSATGRAREDTKRRLVAAAVETLKARGYAGASAREIAAAGGVNQALVFYHFGSVQNLLLAALDWVSEQRMESYATRFEQARSIVALAALAREIYAEDLANGYVTVLGEMVAGGVSDPELGAAVVERVQPWIELVETKLSQLTAGTAVQTLLPAREVAFAIVALYLGADMLSHLQRDHQRSEALLDAAARNAPLADLLLAGIRSNP